MNAAAKSLEFEKASELKRKIFALEHIQDVALIKEDVRSYEVSLSGAPEYKFDQSESPDVQPKDVSFRIEAYDTAHMSGKESAGVMTVVCDGDPNKNEYRRFKLSPEIGNNDVKSLREIIERRLNHPEWRMPDIMVIDGGQGQLNLAESVAKEKGLVVPIVAVVKDERHKPREVLGNQEIVEKHKKAILLANAEAHRFALSYHRKLRRMRNPKRGKF
jgi:excinuclease UvrABC nuclease subunit